MKRWIPMLLVFPLVGLLAWTASGFSGQNPNGEAPHGFAFAEDAQGARVSGVLAAEFRGVPQCAQNLGVIAAPEIVSVLRLRKAGTLAAFSNVTTCNSCANACEDFGCGLLVVPNFIAEIQMCMLDALDSQIGDAMLGDPNADVRLKNVEEFQPAPPVLDPVFQALSYHFVADIELSVK